MKEKIAFQKTKKEERRKRLGRDARGKERGGGVGQKMSKTKREEIALKAIGLSELNHRVPAVQSDSALALYITLRCPDTDTITATKMERIKEVSAP